MAGTLPNMVRINPDASISDYISFPVLISNIDNSLSPKKYRRLYKYVCSRVGPFDVKHGICRPRYVRSCNEESVLWGSFQAHRRIYGLIGLAEQSDRIHHKFKQLQQKHGVTLIDSHLFVISCDAEPSPKSLCEFPFRRSHSFNSAPAKIERTPINDDISVLPPAYNLNYVTFVSAKDFEEETGPFIDQFCRQVGLVIYSRALDLLPDNLKAPLPLTPLEVETQPRGRLSKKDTNKSCEGRNRKCTADLCLLVGSYNRALSLYQGAYDLLKEVDDSFWVCGVMEGSSIAHHFAMKDKTPLACRKSFPRLFSGVLDNLKFVLDMYSKTEWSTFVECDLAISAFNCAMSAKDFRMAHFFISKSVCASVSTKRIDLIDAYSKHSMFYRMLGCWRKCAFFSRLYLLGVLNQYKDSPANKDRILELHHSILETANLFHIFDDSATFEPIWPLLVTNIVDILLSSLQNISDRCVLSQDLTSRVRLYYIQFGVFQMFRHSAIQSNSTFTRLLDLITYESPDHSLTDHSSHQLESMLGHSLDQPSLNDILLVRDINYHQLPPNLAPHIPGDRVSSPFIYTPSMSTRVVWVTQSPSVIELLLRNPESFHMEISHFKPRISGVNVFIPPVSFSIPPCSLYSVPLRVLPLSTGFLSIDGVEMNVLGIEVFLPVRSELTRPIKVVEELPLLFLIQDLRSPTREVSFDFEHHYVSLNIVTFLVSSVDFSVCLVNASEVTINHVQYDTKPQENGVFRFSIVSTGTPPLHPHSRFIVTFRVESLPYKDAQPNRHTFEHRFMYSSICDAYRLLRLVVSLERRSPLEVEHFGLHSCGPPYLTAQVVMTIRACEEFVVTVGGGSPIEFARDETKEVTLEMKCLEVDRMTIAGADEAVLGAMRSQLWMSLVIPVDGDDYEATFDPSTLPWSSRQLSGAYYYPFRQAECKFNGVSDPDYGLKVSVDHAIRVEGSITDVSTPHLLSPARWDLLVGSQSSDSPSEDFLCVGTLSCPVALTNEGGQTCGKYNSQLIFLKRGLYTVDLELSLGSDGMSPYPISSTNFVVC